MSKTTRWNSLDVVTRFAGMVCLSLLVLIFWGCAPKVVEPDPDPEPELKPDLYFIPADDRHVLDVLSAGLKNQGIASWLELQEAIERSLVYLNTRKQEADAICRPELCLQWQDITQTMETLLFLLPELDDNPELLRYYFDFYKVNPDVLLTGYYEPLLEASRYEDHNYSWPIYAVPCDLFSIDLGRFHPRWQGQTLVYRQTDNGIAPYYDRKSIDQKKVLYGRGLELAWVDDPVDLFFLHIQGSGRLRYPDGQYEHVLYAGRNGLRYVALGRVMVEMGYLKQSEVSMQSIRAVLEDNPDKIQEFLNTNPSYIFFHLHDEGPYGSTGQILTPFVSVASDPAVIPWGSAMIMDAVLPAYGGRNNYVSGPVFAQDTGGAIRGRHLDLFTGFGQRAEFLAGKMRDRATVYFMVKKNDQN
ncbi:murein transglycosylase A [Desulfonatronovibrio magnus]|uniref:murein transglycosylase A n=1 Tax=Desulfonatronovibrio magnus TaxID=698827 RepID=UPI0006964302|nr:MltA domain-containing protein [Desulfonatronovibrio magnus]